ncbi:MAG: head-tail connector protein [Pseudomonadota bacterium]
MDRYNTRTTVGPETYWLERDMSQPRIVAAGSLPAIPSGAVAEVSFTAGFSDSFAGLPADLSQAVMMLAAHYYEHREATGMNETALPYGVSILIERYKTIRLVAGARA